MADLDEALRVLSVDQEGRRTMIVVPLGLAVWLAGEKVMLGESQQELINACIYHARKYNKLPEVLAEYRADVEAARTQTSYKKRK